MRLWSFQTSESTLELEQTGKLTTQWERYANQNAWKEAYKWMAEEMEFRSIALFGCAPLWAWHSCLKFGHAPTNEDARALLSDNEILNGIKLIEFECPENIALLSYYSKWNDLLDRYLFKNNWEAVTKNDTKGLFVKKPKKMREGDCIQAALPFIASTWITDIRHVF